MKIMHLYLVDAQNDTIRAISSENTLGRLVKGRKGMEAWVEFGALR